MITIDNYEAYLLQYAEGMLSKDECAEVEDFLKDHPDLQDEMEQFYDVELKVTAPDIEMPNKSALKHRLVMPIVWRSAVAACLIGGMVVLGINLMLPQHDAQMIAKVESPMQLKVEKIEPIVLNDEVKVEKSIATVESVTKKNVSVKELVEENIEIEEPIIVEDEVIEEDNFQEMDQTPLMESNQLIAMATEESIVIKTENLIQIEDSVIQSNDLIKIESLSLKTIVDTYVTAPLIAQAEKTKVKVVDQLYAVADEFKNRYINN